jgi:hypothetical protein
MRKRLGESAAVLALQDQIYGLIFRELEWLNNMYEEEIFHSLFSFPFSTFHCVFIFVLRFFAISSFFSRDSYKKGSGPVEEAATHEDMCFQLLTLVTTILAENHMSMHERERPDVLFSCWAIIFLFCSFLMKFCFFLKILTYFLSENSNVFLFCSIPVLFLSPRIDSFSFLLFR